MSIRKQHLYIFIILFFSVMGFTISYTINISKNQEYVHIKNASTCLTQVQGHVNRAEHYFHIDVNLEAALDEYYQALALEPNNIQVLLGLVKVYKPLSSSLEVRNEVVNILNYILSIEPENEIALVNLLQILAYGTERELMEANAIINQLPNDYRMSLDMVLISSRVLAAANIITATDFLESALETFPNQPDILYKLGLLYYNNGEPSKSIYYLTKASKAIDNAMEEPSKHSISHMEISYCLELATAMQASNLHQTYMGW